MRRSMTFWQRFSKSVRSATSDESFLTGLKRVETLVSKILSIAMVIVLLVSVVELCIFLSQEVLFSTKLADTDKFFTVSLIKIFGLFLNILVALEILENITAYLKKHVVQVELVIVTSLTAVARKIIIFDFSKATGIELMALALAVVSLSGGYWIIRRANRKLAE